MKSDGVSHLSFWT